MIFFNFGKKLIVYKKINKDVKSYFLMYIIIKPTVAAIWLAQNINIHLMISDLKSSISFLNS
jgi:hypothetical protein